MSVFKWYIWTVTPVPVTEFLVFDYFEDILFTSQVHNI